MFFVLSRAWDKEKKTDSHACDKTKNIFLYFFTEFTTYHLSYFHLQWVMKLLSVYNNESKAQERAEKNQHFLARFLSTISQFSFT